MCPFDYLLYAGVVFAWSTSWYPLSLQIGAGLCQLSNPDWTHRAGACRLCDGDFPVIALLISTIFEGYVWAPLSFVELALVMAGNVMMIRARD